MLNIDHLVRKRSLLVSGPLPSDNMDEIAGRLDQLSRRLRRLETAEPEATSVQRGDPAGAPWVLRLSLSNIEIRRLDGAQTLFRFRLATFPLLIFFAGVGFFLKGVSDRLERSTERMEVAAPGNVSTPAAEFRPERTRPLPLSPSAKVPAAPSSADLYQKGFEEMTRGELDLAVARFEAALNQDPAHVEAKRMLILSLWNLADEQMEKKEWLKASKTLKTLSKHRPGDPQVSSLLKEVEGNLRR